MNYGLITVAYREKRFMRKFLRHVPSWIDNKIVLLSDKPWNGNDVPDDGTFFEANSGSPVLSTWETEHDQRNSGLAFLEEYDWVIVLDPDEFLSNEDWNKLKDFLDTTDADAVVAEGQYTYWKDGWVADPPKDYQMLIAVRPHVKFVDKRVVNTSYTTAPVWVHHFSWARTDAEVWNKISHYAHAEDFDIKKWYEEVWLKWQPGMKDVHPTTPSTLHDFIRAELPEELERLKLWP
jgi:hypothetical protein